ncbi:hypothetical protein MRX96_045377 [Rhipicephalus microplus]
MVRWPDVTTTESGILFRQELPELQSRSLVIWLVKIEAGFYVHNITSQHDKYAITVVMLHPALRCVVPPPGPASGVLCKRSCNWQCQVDCSLPR